MKIKSLRCPDCDSQIRMEGNKKVLFCQYCGAQLYVDDEVKRSEHKKIIVNESGVEMARFNHDAKLREIEYKERKEKRENRSATWGLIIGLLLIIAPIAVLAYSYSKEQEQQNEYAERGLINPGRAEDYEGKDVDVVVEILKQKGFENFELIDLDDSWFFLGNDREVDTISISGRTDFNNNLYVFKDTKIIISYH